MRGLQHGDATHTPVAWSGPIRLGLHAVSRERLAAQGATMKPRCGVGTAPRRGDLFAALRRLQAFQVLLETPPANNDPLRLDRASCAAVPYEFEGPCLLEVRPEQRRGAGRWVTRMGYTEDVLRAEVFSASDAHRIAAEGWAYPVDAAGVQQAVLRKVQELGRRIVEVR